ncbi:DUF1868 domain-containing protein [Oscillatoria sp. FACHB-1406]|uniref:DUF1868 domain-containing protein n=1 Tax=Oscillatoria sp. FACHB-1406 TaxID=2692846 RepID=UPI001684B279|nr:DUF1868 domain-containing protein [Oscillatoria sp. FACHB-1406]MBD2578172.1 DUF1868 domain-containing protein [Oscillatoria sp. FACHB-1406]
MDDSYPIYLNRVARLTRHTTLRSQLAGLQTSPKFKDGKAVSFPGYSVVVPLWEGGEEVAALTTQLAQAQQKLIEQLDDGLIVPVNPDSFHLTVADLIWDEAYREAVEQQPNYEEQLRAAIAQSFTRCAPTVSQDRPIPLQVLGLMLRPRAIMAALVPQSEDGYDRILHLRRTLYQNSELMRLGIEQQYDFTGHITLGYFGKISPNLDRDRVAEVLSALNEEWLEIELPSPLATRVQLCKFDHMNRFYREPDWPELAL